MTTDFQTTSKKFTPPVLECTGALLPNVPNMTEFFKQLGKLPAVMALRLAELPTSIAIALWDNIESIVVAPLDSAEDILGAFSPVLPSQTTNSVRDRPEEWRRRADDLQENYKLYFQLSLIELLGSFARHILQIPLPFVPGCVVGDLTTSGGRKKIRDTVIAKFDFLKNLVPEPFRSIINGDFGYLNPEESLRNFFSYLLAEFKKLIKNPLFAVFGFLIKKFEEIWDSLRLPPLPAILSLDPAAILNALIEPFKAKIKQEYEKLKSTFQNAKEALQKIGSAADYLKNQLSKILGSIIEKILRIQIPIIGITLGDLLGIKGFDDLRIGEIVTPQEVLARLANRLANIFEDIVMIILEEWIQKVKKFLDKIGLGIIFSLVPLTFCKFLKIAFPAIFSLGTQVSSKVNSSLAVIEKADKARKNAAVLGNTT